MLKNIITKLLYRVWKLVLNKADHLRPGKEITAKQLESASTGPGKVSGNEASKRIKGFCMKKNDTAISVKLRVPPGRISQ